MTVWGNYLAKYLEKRRQGWYAVLDVPKALRTVLGRKRFVQTLKTDSPKVAERRKGPVIAVWKGIIEKARSTDPLEQDIAVWRQLLSSPGLSADDRATIEDQLYDRAIQLEEVHDYEKAKAWYDQASGRLTSIRDLAELWLAEPSHLSPKTLSMKRSDLFLLAEHHTMPHAVSRKVASEFVDCVLRPGRATPTVNRMLSSYTTFWKWMIRKGYLDSADNPWIHQRLSESSTVTRTKRRPLSEKAGAALIAAVDRRSGKYPADSLMVRLLALTGARLGEICGLALDDIVEKLHHPHAVWLAIRPREGRTTKNPQSIRTIPVVHPKIVPLLRGRLSEAKSRGWTEFFPEYPPKGLNGRTGAVSHRLNRLLDKIDPAAEVVSGHSWRNRVITQLEHGGIPPWEADFFVGHARPGTGRKVYSAGISDKQLVTAASHLFLPGESVGAAAT